MEHWQFLIQKQGDRSWHTLESPYIQILEGRYRVLARSNLPNTDVEVRVTHSSTHEVPPKRRIQKQSRRTNSEGLMAVIPFTLLKPGMWELRCSGDLMSDIFGKSWQHSIYLQVLSQLVDGEVEKLIGGGNLKSDPVDLFMIPLPYPQHSDEQDSGAGDNLISLSSEFNTNSNSVTNEFSAEISSIDSDNTTITADKITESNEQLSIEITSDRIDSVSTQDVEVTSDRLDSVSTQDVEITSDRIDSVSTQDVEVIGDRIDSVSTQDVEITSDRLDSVSTQDVEITSDRIDSVSTQDVEVIGDRIDLASTEEITDSDLVISPLSAEQEDAIIDQPVSPVWLKGETAEQILQSLLDQALPTSDLLLEDEQLEEIPTIQPAPPLLLTLEQENYIARWGQGLSINANVELQSKPHFEDEPQYSTNLQALEVTIELRSPLSSEILAQVRQPLADNLLPFTISTAINIPVKCESKLLLGELSLYGSITDFGEVILLASRSFTITAEVTELLAMTVVPQFNQQNLLGNSSALTVSLPNKEPESSISLGLELFNLVKTPLTEPQTILPSPHQPLPPQINLLPLKKTGDLRSPKLPNLPENPTSAIAANDAVTETLTERTLETEQQDNTLPEATKIPLAPINLEQLAIKNRRGWMLGNIFPYLKRLKTSPAEKAEATINPPNELDTSVVEESLQVQPAVTDDNNLNQKDSVLETLTESSSELLAESVADTTPSLEFSDDSILEPAAPLGSELIAEVNPYSSPLIRKWMQSQGYDVPELPPIESQNHETKVVESEIVPVKEELAIPSIDAESENLDVESKVNLDIESSLSISELWENTQTNIISGESEALNVSVETETENIPQALSTSSLLAELPLDQKIKIPRAWLAQEIVVDDTDNELEGKSTSILSGDQQSISDSSNLLPASRERSESLPIPQLHVPKGELIAGQSIRVRVELPEVPSQVVVKLWIEDCQTRGLLDGPHLLKDLLPKPLGGVEVMTQINVPFGCVEIRLEAIAFNPDTQQESHKATAVRTVIPPDLPNFHLDEWLGL